jgi:4-amino-4-deoxy-L-arabinose transferase-like glycosyltransferase
MKNKTAYLFLAAAAILFISDTVQKIPYTADDTFIYMQYARNISSGNGFSFNAGEPSYGITSPFWVIILTIPYFLGINAFWFSKILDLICAVLAVIMFYRLAKILFTGESGSFLSLLAASLFVLNIWFIRWSFTGMETNLAVLTVLLILFSYYKKSYAICFFLLGLFFLIRPEGFVLFMDVLITVIF